MLIGGGVLMLILVLVGLFLIDAYRGGVNDAYLPGTRVIMKSDWSASSLRTFLFV